MITDGLYGKLVDLLKDCLKKKAKPRERVKTESAVESVSTPRQKQLAAN
jgi:hypothetical protein